MGKKLLWYSAALIGAYLALSHATQGGQLLTAVGSTYASGVRVLQGR